MKTLFTLLSILVFTTAFSQDVIIMRDGEEINAQVLVIGNGKIAYKLFEHKDTTTRSVPQVDVFMIKYAGGAKQVFDEMKMPVDEAKLRKLLRPQQNDYEYYMERYKKKKTLGIVFTSVGAPALITGITLFSVGMSEGKSGVSGSYNSELITPGIMTSVGGFVFTLIGGINFAIMPNYKNKANEAKAYIGFEPSIQSITPAGNVYGTTTGLAMKITF